MQILFEEKTKKYLNCMRLFQPVTMVKGPFAKYRREISAIGGKYDAHRNGMIIPAYKKAKAGKIKITVIDEIPEGKGKNKARERVFELKNECVVQEVTDPTPKETIKRVGRNYLGENLEDYIVVNMDNNDFLAKEEEIRKAKDIQLGNLPEQDQDGSYLYYDGLFTIVPKDPPSADELAKKAEKEAVIGRYKILREQIKSALLTMPDSEAIKLMLEYEQLKIKMGR